MNKATSRERDISQSFRATLTHLFIQEKDPKFIYLFLGMITLIGSILRLYVINNPIGYDEAYTFLYFASKPFKYILADYHAPNNHIFNSILIGIAYRLFGNHEWVVRLPALIASILGIPAAYFAARRFFTREQALAASAILAVSISLIDDAANGRGYTLVALFSLLLVNFAGILLTRQTRSALIAYAITGALGFYTIPIFLYPMAGISLWVAVTYLTENDTWRNRLSKLGIFLGTCIASGVLTLILYSPVILFGTGFNSIVGNDIVKPMTWHEFTDSIEPRLTRTWSVWTPRVKPVLEYTLLSGFLISVIFYRRVSRQRLPLQVFLLLAIIILLVLQRVAPLPRIWSYLEMFYLFFSAVGLTWLAQIIIRKLVPRLPEGRMLSSIVLLVVLSIFTYVTITTQNSRTIASRVIAPEKFAAEYLAKNLSPDDTILAIAPVDIRTAYYLMVNGVSYDVFYKRDHPVKIQNALVVLRTTENFDTPESVLEFFHLTSELNLADAELIFEYKPLQIHSIPAKSEEAIK